MKKVISLITGTVCASVFFISFEALATEDPRGYQGGGYPGGGSAQNSYQFVPDTLLASTFSTRSESPVTGTPRGHFGGGASATASTPSLQQSAPRTPFASAFSDGSEESSIDGHGEYFGGGDGAAATALSPYPPYQPGPRLHSASSLSGDFEPLERGEPDRYLGGGGGGGGAAAASPSPARSTPNSARLPQNSITHASLVTPVASVASAPQTVPGLPAPSEFGRLLAQMYDLIGVRADGTGLLTEHRVTTMIKLMQISKMMDLPPTQKNMYTRTVELLIGEFFLGPDTEFRTAIMKYDQTTDARVKMQMEKSIVDIVRRLYDYAYNGFWHGYGPVLRKNRTIKVRGTDRTYLPVVNNIQVNVSSNIRETMSPETKQLLRKYSNMVSQLSEVDKVIHDAESRIGSGVSTSSWQTEFFDNGLIRQRVDYLRECMDGIELLPIQGFDPEVQTYTKRVLYRAVGRAFYIDLAVFISRAESLQDRSVREREGFSEIKNAEKYCIAEFEALEPPLTRLLTEFKLPGTDQRVPLLKNAIFGVWQRYVNLFRGGNQDRSLTGRRSRIATTVESVISNEDPEEEQAPVGINPLTREVHRPVRVNPSY